MNKEEVLNLIRDALGEMSAREIDITNKLNPKYNEAFQYIKENLK
jgi:hypothetical protein